jgi:hypothetical protein
MWCVFHNAQWYWSDNLCKLVTDQWRGSLGVRDSESCWFTEEIGTYMSCWESPGDLPLVIETIDKLSSFLLIFELFSLIFYWKYSIFLHETPHTWNMTGHIFWCHWNLCKNLLNLKKKIGHLYFIIDDQNFSKFFLFFFIFEASSDCAWMQQWEFAHSIMFLRMTTWMSLYI